jgi:4-amino-4-deoxy-L-arabinose transferase-like glycosyltransferase
LHFRAAFDGMMPAGFIEVSRVNLPTPAIVAERGVERLPRLALILLCAAYVIPGIFGRDPWRNADLTAFGFMASIAHGDAPWWQPAIAGIPAEGGPLPYWLGALAIKALPFLDAPVAARLPYALVLVGVLVAVWYACFHLARTEAAQPVAFAFGGEAQAVDYARALADGALLALMASLGLLQLGHETTPELMQLLAVSVYLYGLAAAPFRRGRSRLAVLAALPVLAASGAPAVACALGLLGLLLNHRSRYDEAKAQRIWLLASLTLAVLAAWAFDGWAWRIRPDLQVGSLLSLLVWFCWPAGPLALWTLWRWRRHGLRRHITVPAIAALVPLAACIGMDGSERALLLALPSLAILAAFALPTLSRGFSAAVDWFSVFFFSAAALFFWLYYLSMHTGWPPRPLANLRRLAEGFEPRFSLLALLFAVAATLAWLALVRWRTARHRHALWKSLALPAGGVALGWLLVMSLLLPPLDYARSLAPLVGRMKVRMPADVNCLAAPGQNLATLAALEWHGGWRVHGRGSLEASSCSHAVIGAGQPVPAGWQLIAQVKRPTDRSGSAGLALLKRQ